jgi:GTP-binding protein EngB required for normal cell division
VTVSTTTVRWLLFALLAAALGGALLLALLSVDTALSVWQRLQGLPAGFRYVYIAVLSSAAVGLAWLGWRLLRRRRRPIRRAPPPPVTRAQIERRAADLALAQAPVPMVADELGELDRRAAGGELHLAVFGAINAGKSALIRALVPGYAGASDVLGGTTRQVEHHRGQLPDGTALVVADVPGTQEDAGREALARDEVLRAHWVLYLCAGDLSRTEAAEVAWLRAFGKPLLLVLNQADRYAAAERAQLLARLRERAGVEAVAVSAGGREAVEVVRDGVAATQWRERAPDLGELPRLLRRRLAAGAQALEPARAGAVLRGLDVRLGQVEAEHRAAQAEAVVVKYTRRAVVGALAAVAPGSDLVIQGALGTGLVRELAAIYQTPVRQIDIDGLVERASRTLRTTTAVVLAIAGNAAKAFPGLGTIGGGLAHAVAYGMIFDSLGRAVAATLADGGRLDAEAATLAFAEKLRASPAPHLLGVLRSAIGAGSAADGARERAS